MPGASVCDPDSLSRFALPTNVVGAIAAFRHELIVEMPFPPRKRTWPRLKNEMHYALIGEAGTRTNSLSGINAAVLNGIDDTFNP